MSITRRYRKAKKHIKKHRRLAAAAGLALVLIIAAAIVLWPQPQKDHPPAAAPNLSDICPGSGNPNKYPCYRDELNSIVKQYGPEAATALIKRQYSQVPYVKSQCHQLMHVIGRAAYAKYNNLADTFARGDQFCWSGFYHGIMEQVSTQKGYDYIIKNANSICTPIAKKSGKYSFYNYNCVHGLGHGFMEVLNGDLFKSLTACDSINDDWSRNSCYGGVFMQNIMNEQGPDSSDEGITPYLKSDQPMYPCTALDDKYKEQCYLMQTSYALQVENYDFGKVFGLCDATDAAYRDTCYQSLGRDASGQSISDISSTKATCLLGSTQEAQTNCVIGAVKDFVSYLHDDKRAYQLCSQMPDYMIDTCNSTVKSYYSTF